MKVLFQLTIPVKGTLTLRSNLFYKAIARSSYTLPCKDQYGIKNLVRLTRSRLIKYQAALLDDPEVIAKSSVF